MSLSYSGPTYEAMLTKVEQLATKTPAAFCEIFKEEIPGFILDYRLVVHENEQLFVMVVDRNHELLKPGLETGKRIPPEVQAMSNIVDGYLPGFSGVNLQFAFRSMFRNDPEGHYQRWADEGWQ